MDVDTRTEMLTQWGLILSGMIYGMHLVLAVIGFREVYKRPPPKKKQQLWLGAYLLLLLCFATAGFFLQAWWTQVAFIKNRGYPGGPTQFLLDNVHSGQNKAVTAMYLILNWCSDGIILHRFHVLWTCRAIGVNRKSRLAFIVLVALALFITAIVCFPSITGLGVNLWNAVSSTPGLAYMALSLSVNTTLTALIIGRLLYLRQRINKVLQRYRPGQTDMYTSVAAMLVESAAPYTVVALLAVIACGVASPMQYVLLPTLGQFQAIPPLLIISRVLSGSALSQRILDTLLRLGIRHKSSRTLSDVRFASQASSLGAAKPHPPLSTSLYRDFEAYGSGAAVGDFKTFDDAPSPTASMTPTMWPAAAMPWEFDEAHTDSRYIAADIDIEKQLQVPKPVAFVNR
ncbi:hypothetical protein PsYK624_093290 [Phanerochaete sordida]|uniref:Uncharacterized protein n=1 Tax=Phanerochaete sordida TaxID=48140 RepID=A0A9P3GE68_9APHY|nr:hypothetical protein PsYK624_093290 [Phanerochaete sordida]